MNKEHLLKIAQDCPSSSETALDLGAQLSSAESVTAVFEMATVSRARNHKLAAIWNSILKIAGTTMGISFFTSVFMNGAADSAVPYWPIWLTGIALVLLVLSAYIAGGAELDGAQDRYTVDNAVPIAGTSLCDDALTYLETKRPEVLAWRDLAINERGQLYVFDVEIMRSIDESLTLAETAAENAAKNEEAFLKLHSIGHADDVPPVVA